MSDAAAGFLTPGSKVDVLATFKRNNKVHAFSLLVNVLVVAVDSPVVAGKVPEVTVSLAVVPKEALVLALAKTRGCQLNLLLRNPTREVDRSYNIDEIIKLLGDDEQKSVQRVEGGEEPPKIPPAETFEIAPAPHATSVDAIAGNSRLVGHDRAARTGQAIEERGLTDVRSANNHNRWQFLRSH